MYIYIFVKVTRMNVVAMDSAISIWLPLHFLSLSHISHLARLSLSPVSRRKSPRVTDN